MSRSRDLALPAIVLDHASRVAMYRQIDELDANGLIEARQGTGTFVPHGGGAAPPALTAPRVLRDAQFAARPDVDAAAILLPY